MKKYVYLLLVTLLLGACATQKQETPAPYSQRMVESHGLADFYCNRHYQAKLDTTGWDYVSGLVANAVLKAWTMYPEKTEYYDAVKAFADHNTNADGSMILNKKGKSALRPSNIDDLPAGTYRLAAACAPDYPISDHPVPLSLLCRHPLLLRECGSAVRDTFDHTLSLAGLKASPVWESVNSFALMKATGAGLGVTILPEALLSDSLRQHKLRRIHLENVSMENHMLAILRKEQYITRPLQILLDYIRSDKED